MCSSLQSSIFALVSRQILVLLIHQEASEAEQGNSCDVRDVGEIAVLKCESPQVLAPQIIVELDCSLIFEGPHVSDEISERFVRLEHLPLHLHQPELFTFVAERNVSENGGNDLQEKCPDEVVRLAQGHTAARQHHHLANWNLRANSSDSNVQKLFDREFHHFTGR